MRERCTQGDTNPSRRVRVRRAFEAAREDVPTFKGVGWIILGGLAVAMLLGLAGQ
jgi:hypothetical protein